MMDMNEDLEKALLRWKFENHPDETAAEADAARTMALKFDHEFYWRA